MKLLSLTSIHILHWASCLFLICLSGKAVLSPDFSAFIFIRMVLVRPKLIWTFYRSFTKNVQV